MPQSMSARWRVSVGTGLGGGLIIKVTGFDRPLLPAPEKGFCVITVAVPGLATSAAGTTAVTLSTLPEVSVVTVVFSFCPFHSTKVLATNPAPLIVSVKSGLPALILEGERNWTECAGIGLKRVPVIVASGERKNRNQCDSPGCPEPLHETPSLFRPESGPRRYPVFEQRTVNARRGHVQHFAFGMRCRFPTTR